MIEALARNPFGAFLLEFARLVGGLSRCVDDQRHRAGYPSEAVFAAVLNHLDRMFCRVQRIVLAHEPGRPVRTPPSAACHEAAARAAAAAAAGGTAGAALESSRGTGIRLPQGFGWLPRLLPDAEAYASWMRAVLNEKGVAELMAASPSACRTLRSFCNMLGVGSFMVADAPAAALGTYTIGRGWRRPDDAPAVAPASSGPDSTPPVRTPGRRQDE